MLQFTDVTGSLFSDEISDVVTDLIQTQILNFNNY